MQNPIPFAGKTLLRWSPADEMEITTTYLSVVRRSARWPSMARRQPLPSTALQQRNSTGPSF